MQKCKNVTVIVDESVHFILETAIKIFALIFVQFLRSGAGYKLHLFKSGTCYIYTY